MRIAAEYLRRGLRYLAVSDPGRLRLRSAATTSLSAATAMLVLIGITSAWGEPITIALLGTVVAVQCSAAVKDKTQAERVVTTLLMPLPAMAAVALAATLLEFGVFAEVGFIAVLFTAVWVRRWAPRGNALGMVGFISYFFSLFLHTTVAQIPMLCGAIIVGACCTLLIRVVVLPDRPRLEIRRLARALRAASIDALVAATERENPDRMRLRRRLDRLGASALMIEDWIDRHNAEELVSITGQSFSIKVFDAQIATEQLVSALWSLAPEAEWPPGLERATTALGSVLHDRPSPEQMRVARAISADAAREADPSSPEGIATAVAHRTVLAHIAIHRIATRAMILFPRASRFPLPTRNRTGEIAARARSALSSGPLRDSDDTATVVPAGEEPEVEAPTHASTLTEQRDSGSHSANGQSAAVGGMSRFGALLRATDDWNPSTRAAVQVAVATSLATLLGELVSPDRWYWAVLTAFLVFNGASSRGQILSRAGHRVVGTVAGVLAGVVIAALVGHNPPLQMVLIIICVFFAFYFAGVSYAMLTFCVTILLAMLYGLLGVFSIEVLALRIEETAVGAAVGLASAYFILATSTSSELATKTTEYLDQLDVVIEESIAAVAWPGTERTVVEATRDLDAALQEVVTAAKPLELRPTARGRRGVKRLMRVLTVGNRAAHQLARAGMMAIRADPDTKPTAETTTALREATEYVQSTVDLVRRSIDGERIQRPERSTETTVLGVMLTATRSPGALRLALRSLSKLNRTLFEALT